MVTSYTLYNGNLSQIVYQLACATLTSSFKWPQHSKVENLRSDNKTACAVR